MRHLILNARSFATCYNHALARYRSRRGIRGNQHPIPDLAWETDRVELPFWHIDPAAPRCRVFVTDVATDFVRIEADGITLGEFSRSELSRSPDEAAATRIVSMGLRPRALPQTLFARLHACDLFIHGIGGAKYDTITDDIIRAHFKIEPPAYACVTATCRLPVRRFNVSDDQLVRATFAARDLRYNLQRYAKPGEFAPALSQEIDARTRAIRESDRLHRERSRDHARRRSAYRAIRRANAALLLGAPGIARRLTDELTEIRLQLASNRIANSREWFFALHARENLATLFDQLNKELATERLA